MSTPASSAMPDPVKKFRTWMTRGVCAIVVAIALGFLTYQLAIYKTDEKSTPAVAHSAQAECSVSRPCALTVKADGSTETVTIKDGKCVCFDPTFWENVSRLGYMTSYNGGPETKYTCTREQVLAGTCSQRIGNTFRFVPEPGVLVPKYWFRDANSSGCS